MRRVTTQITREVLTPALSALLVATFLLLTTQILRVGEAAFGYGLGLGDFLAILALLLPRFFVFTLPLAVLVGVLAGLGRLAADRELLAWRAAGLSPGRLWPAPVLIGLLASGLTLTLTSWGEPRALEGLTGRLATVVERNLAAGLEPGVIHQDIPGVVLHARDRQADGTLGEVFLHMDLDAGQATLAARRARLESTGGRGLRLALEDGEMVRRSGGDAKGQDAPGLDRIRFQSASVALDVAETVTRRARFIGSLDVLTLGDLRRRMHDGPNAWERQRAAVAFHRRLAMPFACLSLAVLGLGMALFAAAPGVRRKGAGFVGGIGAMVAYYLLVRVAENLAVSGVAHPALLLWTPNALFLVAGVALLLGAVRR
jgi:lipopolysaccharide export system permease protein